MLFYAYFSVSRKRNIRRSQNERNQLEKLILEGNKLDRLGVHVRGVPGCPRGWGARPPPWARSLPHGQPGGPPTYFFLPYIPIYPKNFGEHNRSGVPPLETSIATENQSRPVPAPCRRGQSLSGGHLHHPGSLHDEEGVVLPRG